jgi:hypothetical protein
MWKKGGSLNIIILIIVKVIDIYVRSRVNTINIYRTQVQMDRESEFYLTTRVNFVEIFFK